VHVLEIDLELSPGFVGVRLGSPIATGKFHLVGASDNGVSKADELSVSVGRFSSCGVRLAIINLGEDMFNGRYCIPFVAHAFIVCSQHLGGDVSMIRCQQLNDFSCADESKTMDGVLDGGDEAIISGIDELLSKGSINFIVALEHFLAIIELLAQFGDHGSC
jgi:hypothetical protein